MFLAVEPPVFSRQKPTLLTLGSKSPFTASRRGRQHDGLKLVLGKGNLQETANLPMKELEK
jgi:hypothetical protein